MFAWVSDALAVGGKWADRRKGHEFMIAAVQWAGLVKLIPAQGLSVHLYCRFFGEAGRFSSKLKEGKKTTTLTTTITSIKYVLLFCSVYQFEKSFIIGKTRAAADTTHTHMIIFARIRNCKLSLSLPPTGREMLSEVFRGQSQHK